MRYRARRKWRHFKYKILELFFGKQDLKKFLDLDRLDFEDAIKLTGITAEKWLTKKEHDYFHKRESLKYGLQYELARQMAETLARHVEVSEIWDTDEEKYICVGSITLCERRGK